jgi:hypothetical protein
MKDCYSLMKSLLKDTFGYDDRLKMCIKAASYGHILFYKKGEINEENVELDVNSLYSTAMTTIRIPKGKPRDINTETLNSGFNRSSAFFIEVVIGSLIPKHYSRFKVCSRYVIDNIVYQDLITYQNAKIKIIRGIYWEENTIDTADIIKTLLDRKTL